MTSALQKIYFFLPNKDGKCRPPLLALREELAGWHIYRWGDVPGRNSHTLWSRFSCFGTLCTYLYKDNGLPLAKCWLWPRCPTCNVRFTVICCVQKTSWSNKHVTALGWCDWSSSSWWEKKWTLPLDSKWHWCILITDYSWWLWASLQCYSAALC